MFHGRWTDVLRKFLVGFKYFCKKLKGNFREVSKNFLGCSKKVFRVAQGSSMDVSRVLRLF